jgi:N-methylhydantoinase A
MIRLGVDVGGTFTDLVLEAVGADGRQEVFVHKVSSTPQDQSIGVVQGVVELCAIAGIQPGQIDALFHGTTVATNIVIERDGADVGMITTKGFRDILHMARHKRPHNFSLQFDVPWQSAPLIKRRNRIVVDDHYGGMAFDEEGARCATLLADPKTTTMIMGNHGVLVVGRTVAETFNRLYYF